MALNNKHKIVNFLIALVWFINGIFCKVLNLVPRHQEIVGMILGANHSRTMTIIIGVLETVMAIWILSNYKAKLNAIAQMAIVLTMNIIEILLTPDLLLWGKFNALFASIFIIVIYLNQFHFNKIHYEIIKP